MATSTTTGQGSMEMARAAEALHNSLRGDFIQAGDPGYEDARKLYNGMIDKRPFVIAQCADVADVIAAVTFAREQGLPLAIRGGGHNGPGFGSVDDGVVVDLSHMRWVRVEPADGTVRVGGGCLWRDVDHGTQPFGLSVPCGIVSSTGVGGLTLGGGIGYLARKYGLTIDSLLGVDMVLADGSVVTANAGQNPDLFWAVRGGGGNFGVVTSFLFQGRPVQQVYGGPMMWPLEQGADVLRDWQKLILEAPDEVNGWFGYVTVPPGPPFPAEWHMKKMAVIVWSCTGDMAAGEAALKPIRQKMPPAIDFAGPIPMPALNSMFDALFPPGLQWYWRANFFTRYSDDMIALHQQYAEHLPTMQSTMHIYPINGAAGRVAVADTAFAYRTANFAQVIVGVDPDPANNDRMIRWAREYSDALHPYSAGGAYVNMMMDEGEDRVRNAYGPNHARLAAIKARHDPHNLFRVNQNIRPTT